MIIMDRIIKHWSDDESVKYMVRLFSFLKEGLRNNNVDIVIGEATPASEILTSTICEYLGIPYYFPITARIPDDRFLFFKGRYHCDYAKNNNLHIYKKIEQFNGLDFFEKFKERKPKPSYWAKNNLKPRPSLTWISKLIKHMVRDLKYKKSDPTRFTLYWLMKNRVRESCNAALFRFIKTEKDPRIFGEKYIIFPLHKQPESSVDVLGDYYSDQLNLITQIARSLPIGYKLYVKEHSNAIGDRSVGFYCKVKSIPGVRLISPYIDSYSLINEASLVITISGTMGYEAGLLGRPVITFSPVFFNQLPAIRYCSNLKSLPQLILEQICYAESGENFKDKIKFLEEIHDNSFEGVFSDVKSYPEVLSQSNILKVCDAIEAVL